MLNTYKIIIGFCLLIVGLHIWGTIDPSHYNWGVHFFAFYDSSIAILTLVIVLILFIPQVQVASIHYLGKLLRIFSRLPLAVNFLITVGIFLILIYLFPVKFHLLGDGAVLLRSVPLGIMGDEITLSFKNQPLMFWIYRWAMSIVPFENTPNSYTVYYSIDILASIGFFLLVFWSVRNLQIPLPEKFLLGCLLLFGATSQFFFGYVENYILQYITTTAYFISGWLCLEKRVSIVVPILFFLLMTMLHLGDLVFIPTLIILIIFKWKRNKLQLIILLGAVGILGIAVLFLVGFNLVDLTRHLKSGSVDFLKPFKGGFGVFPYPMFSFVHLLDWLNLMMLVAPFGLFLAIALIPTLPKEHRLKNPTTLFLLLSAACGIFFTWIINSALGMARDWDMLSSYFVPLMILPVYLLSQVTTLNHRREIIFLIAVVLLVHTSAWIGVNASDERHLARMRLLNSEKLLSKLAQMNHDEALANFFFGTQQYADARIYYEHYITIDSKNPRIIGNIADVYRKLDEREKYFEMLQRAVSLGSPDPGIYSNIGVEYANRGDTANAIVYNERAIQLNPGMQKAHANLGVLYSGKKNFERADHHFTTAINLGMREPLLFRYAGDVAAVLGDYQRAIRNYDVYLATNSTDSRVRESRNKIYQILQNQRK
ncbi:MAG: tetratricopeptide repeat protein [Bacteroidota bacterium]|nr:tetratricopeptide repeat protein [Bacteroidota bacterium]